jgi:Flp pilus assembly protein TadD
LLIFIAIAGPVSAFYQAGLRREAETARYNADLRRRHAQALVQELVGLRSSGSAAAAGVLPSLQFAMPLVTDRLATSAIENGLVILADADEKETSDDSQAKLHLGVGLLAARQGQSQTAIEHFRRANASLERLREATPEEPRYIAAGAHCQECLGQLYATQGAADISLQHHEEAVRAWRRLVKDHPEETVFRRSLAASLLRLSLAQSLAGRGKIALENVKQSKTLVDAMADIWTEDPGQFYLRACELSDCPPMLADAWYETWLSEDRSNATRRLAR